MPVQPTCEIAEQRVGRIGRDSVHDELMAGYAEGDRLAVFQNRFQPVHEPVRGIAELGMIVRVHRTVVQDDRELDEEVGQTPSQRRARTPLRGLPPCGR
jgi:hypothetical protein